MSYKVGLLDDDTAYQKALMEYFNVRASDPVQLYVFSEPEALERFLATSGLSLLLVGDAFAGQTAPCPVVVLTRHREYAGREQYLFRYQSAKRLGTELMRYVGKDVQQETGRFLFLAVYSPLGRCGKTTYAKHICGQHANSLYVNWEGFSGEPGDRETGSYLLYCIKSRNEACFTFLGEQNIAEIPAPTGFQDIRQVEAADLAWFRDGLNERRLYDCVVFDIGGMTPSDLSIFKEFDRVMIPTLPDAVSKGKLLEFERMLGQEAGNACMECIQYVEELPPDDGASYGAAPYW